MRIVDVIRKLSQSTKQAKFVAENGLRLFKESLSGEALAKYISQVFDEYSKLQNFEPEVPVDGCTCSPGTCEVKPCKFCKDDYHFLRALHNETDCQEYGQGYGDISMDVEVEEDQA